MSELIPRNKMAPFTGRNKTDRTKVISGFHIAETPALPATETMAEISAVMDKQFFNTALDISPGNKIKMDIIPASGPNPKILNVYYMGERNGAMDQLLQDTIQPIITAKLKKFAPVPARDTQPANSLDTIDESLEDTTGIDLINKNPAHKLEDDMHTSWAKRAAPAKPEFTLELAPDQPAPTKRR